MSDVRVVVSTWGDRPHWEYAAPRSCDEVRRSAEAGAAPFTGTLLRSG